MDTPFMKRACNLGLKAVPNFTVLSGEQIEYYEKHLDELPTAIKCGFVLPEKFALLADLGIITVPHDYNHMTCLKSFREKNREKFFDYNEDITDLNFLQPSRILKPGDKFSVRTFKQIVSGTTTSEERMAFLKSRNAVFVGAQGLSLVFEQKRNQLFKDFWYSSFDEKSRLWKSVMVPDIAVYRNWDCGFGFDLGDFDYTWGEDFAFICFSEVK